MKEKPEVKLTRWLIVAGQIRGITEMDGNNRYVVDSFLRRPMNPREGDKIEGRKRIYILTGKGVR